MEAINYYAILEVAPGATVEQIKRSYRRLARKYHPDASKSATDTRMKQLNEAYAVLSDAVKRATYDAQRIEAARNSAVQEAMRRLQEEARRPDRMTWSEGAAGFVRELKKELPPKQPRPKLTWVQGLSGFTREFKKALDDK
jgi:DnaJ-class molecular chaperone